MNNGVSDGDSPASPMFSFADFVEGTMFLEGMPSSREQGNARPHPGKPSAVMIFLCLHYHLHHPPNRCSHGHNGIGRQRGRCGNVTD